MNFTCTRFWSFDNMGVIFFLFFFLQRDLAEKKKNNFAHSFDGLRFQMAENQSARESHLTWNNTTFSDRWSHKRSLVWSLCCFARLHFAKPSNSYASRVTKNQLSLKNQYMKTIFAVKIVIKEKKKIFFLSLKTWLELTKFFSLFANLLPIWVVVLSSFFLFC